MKDVVVSLSKSGLMSNNKILLIKEFRTMFHVGLKEAKDCIDLLMGTWNPETQMYDSPISSYVEVPYWYKDEEQYISPYFILGGNEFLELELFVLE